MTASTVGQTDIRGENISRAVKGFALKNFKLKQVLLQQSSNKWTETYYRESAAELTANGNRDVGNVARGALFPQVDPSWTKLQGVHKKFAAQADVFLEDKLMDAIDVQARSILRVARSIANAVDEYIYTTLTGASGISTAAAQGTGWDAAVESTRKPISDIMTGTQVLMESNYDALDNGFLLLTPHDYRALMENSKVINNPSFKTADVVSNGVVGQIAGLNIIVSTSVDDDEAMIIIGNRAATWKSAVSLTSAVEEVKGVKFVVKSWEIGHVQVTDPAAIYVITDTQE